MTLALDHNRYYRLPWNLPDNAISWLEVTQACNLHCEGCYRENSPKGHKSLDAIKHDLAIFRKYRKTDGVSIAGGDPLVHPEIVEIVRLVAQEGLKPILNTNGLALTNELLRDLKKAGVAGFTFHVDSKQHRPHWRDKNEIELNALRLTFAEMLAEVGGLSCAFNSTVYADTLQYVPDILAWAHEHIDIVHVVVFIAIRAAVLESKFDYYAGAERVDMSRIVYSTGEEHERLDISSNDVVETIRARYPDFEPCAYLLKWHRETGRFQVAAHRPHLNQADHLRMRRAQVHGTGPDAQSSPQRHVPRLYQTIGPEECQGHAPAGACRPRPAGNRPEISRRHRQEPFEPFPAVASAIGHHHSAGGRALQRRHEHVRRLSRYHGLERRIGLVVPTGGTDEVRLLRARRAEGRDAPL
jgi:hypothetical protein